jgi:Zn-finger nucleic acid-binding protein
MALACPRCRCPLATASSSIVTVGQCTDCGGVWLSAAAARTLDAALDRVAQQAGERGEKAAVMPFRDGGGSADVACPECGKICARYPVAGVEVDHCAAHGTWYDAGELKQVAATLRQTHKVIERPEPLPPPPTKGRR